MLVTLNRSSDFSNLAWKKDLKDSTFTILYPDGWKSRPYDEIYIIHSINIPDSNTIQIQFAEGSAFISITNLRSFDIETDSSLFSTLTFVDFDRIVVSSGHDKSVNVVSDISPPEKLQIFGHILNNQ